MATIRDRALVSPPRCLDGIVRAPAELIEDRGAEAVAIRVGLDDSLQPCTVWGYELRAYNLSYDGRDFISPLSLTLEANQRAVVFDSEMHGYHGEMDSSAKFHGTGDPQAFACPNCRATRFSVRVQFDYWDACYDLLDEEPEISIQDYFCNFMMEGACFQCGSKSRIADMDL